MDLMMLAEALANAGHEGAPQIADQLRRYAPTEAELAIGVWRYRRGEIRAAADSLARAFRAARADPWVYSAFLDRSLTLATRLGATHLEVARPLVSAVSQRFAAGLMEERRIRTRILLASALQDEQLLADAFAEVEPWVPWEQPILAARYACYRRLHHPLEKVAQREYDEFLRAAPTSF